jgi:hypothetical protein
MGALREVARTADLTLEDLQFGGDDLVECVERFSATSGDPLWYLRPEHVVAGRVVSGLDLHVPSTP